MIKYTTEPRCQKCLNKDLNWTYQEYTKQGKHIESIFLRCKRCGASQTMWCHDHKEDKTTNKVWYTVLRENIFDTKRKLYHLLTQKNYEDFTDCETNIMYYLCLDDNIQSFLKEN